VKETVGQALTGGGKLSTAVYVLDRLWPRESHWVDVAGDYRHRNNSFRVVVRHGIRQAAAVTVTIAVDSIGAQDGGD
jgi:hypothetical protein